MNRFKFRVWTGTRFLTEVAITDSGSILTYDWHHDYGKSWGHDSSDDYIIQQSTGIIDRNGKEIFEGDIVSYNRRGGIVSDDRLYKDKVVCSKMAPYMFFFSRDTRNPINHWNFLFDTFEVIGNIYENPELYKN